MVTGTPNSDYPNGYFTVFVQQPLVASGASAFATSIVVTILPGDDFAFLDPNLDCANNYILVSASVKTPLFQSATRHFDHRIDGARRTPEQVASFSGGEIIKSLRTLIKRKSPHFIKRFDTGTGNGMGQAMDFPWFVAGYNSQSTLGPPVYDPQFQILPCYLSNAAVPFAAFSGSVRHTIFPLCTNAVFGSTPPTHVFATRRPAGNGNGPFAWGCGSNSINSQTLSFLGMANGGDIGNPNLQNGQPFNIEVPFIAQAYAVGCPVSTHEGDSAVRVGYLGGGLTAPTKLAFIDYVSAGDDFDLFEWIGVPPLSYFASDSTEWQGEPA